MQDYTKEMLCVSSARDIIKIKVWVIKSEIPKFIPSNIHMQDCFVDGC